MTLPEAKAPQSAAQVAPRRWIPAFFAGFSGWTLDSFDFFLVVFSLTAMGQTFGKTDAQMALVLTATLAFRPFGSILFGLMADRVGRRLPLILNLVLFAAVEILTSTARTFVWFLVFRALFGIAMGGQWGLSTSMAMENVPPRYRGVLSGLLQQGYSVGYLCTALAYFTLGERHSWRLLFLLGTIPALLTAAAIALWVEESPAWKRARRMSWAEFGQALASHWKLLLYITVFMTAIHMTSHGTQDMYPTFLQRVWGLAPRERAAMSSFSMVGAVAGGLVMGWVSDKLGRRKAIVLAYGIGLLIIPAWAFGQTLVVLVLGAFTLQFMVQGALGVIPAHLSEMSPNSIRGFLPSFCYQCGVFIASAIIFVEASFAQHASYPVAMAVIAGAVFLLAMALTLLGPERRGIVFGDA